MHGSAAVAQTEPPRRRADAALSFHIVDRDSRHHAGLLDLARVGVLFFDPDGRNAITEARQYVFTEWNPTAAGDLEALRSVFDTNGDGKLTAADTEFAKFKVMVTNADGSTTAVTLASLGITEIDLTGNAVNVRLPDGSAITGQTTFTREDGMAVRVANGALVADRVGGLAPTPRLFFAFLLAMISAFPVAADDLCASGKLLINRTDEALQISLSYIPDLTLTTVANCRLESECEYELQYIGVMSSDETKWGALRITDICRATIHFEETIENKKIGSPVTFFGLVTQRRFDFDSHPEGLAIESFLYHDAPTGVSVGFFTDDYSSGDFFSLPVNATQIYFIER